MRQLAAPSGQIVMRYYVELQVLDISIISYRLETTTRCARSILTVRNDNRVCTHFGPVRLERMTGPITPMTCTIALVNHTFLWWRHRVIQICVLRLTRGPKQCSILGLCRLKHPSTNTYCNSCSGIQYLLQYLNSLQYFLQYLNS